MELNFPSFSHKMSETRTHPAMGRPVSLELSLEAFAPFGPVKSPRDWDWMNGTLAHSVVGPFKKRVEARRTE
jgi:hypothetical protein